MLSGVAELTALAAQGWEQYRVHQRVGGKMYYICNTQLSEAVKQKDA